MLESQYLRDKHWLERQVSFIQEASNLYQSLSDVWLFCDPVDYSSPGSSIHGISQARILEWVAICFSRGSSRPRDQIHVSCISCIGGRISFFYHWATWEATWGGGKLVSKHQDWRFCSNGKIFKRRIIWEAGSEFLLSSAVCRLFLIGGWWGNRVGLQESCTQPEVTVLHLGGGLSSCRRTQKLCYISSLMRNRDPALLLLDCSSSLQSLPPWLAMVGLNLPFEMQQGQGGWKKLISYKWEIGNTERICSWEGPTESCSPSFSPMRLPCSPICLFQEGDPSRAQEWALF